MARTQKHIEIVERNLRLIEETLIAAGESGCKLRELAAACGISDTQAACYIKQSNCVLSARVPQKHKVRYFHVSQQEARDTYFKSASVKSGTRYSKDLIEQVLRHANGGKTASEIQKLSGRGARTVEWALAYGKKHRGLKKQYLRSGKVLWWAAHEKMSGSPGKLETRIPEAVARLRNRKPTRDLRVRILPTGEKLTTGADFIPNMKYTVDKPEPVFSSMKYGQYLDA